MAISFIGAQGATGATVTIPAHQVGDLILIFAYRDGSNTAPTTPTAGGTVPTWTLIGSSGGNTNSSNFRYAIATATTTTSGTWTNATELICLVYRDARVGASAGAGATGTVITYPALTLQRTNNTSEVVGVAGHRTATNVEQAPTGMTNRASAGTEAAGHDTNTPVSSWTAQTVTVNASSGWRSWTLELRDEALTVTADRGQFALTGRNANLNRGYRLTADRGQFSLTGGAANFNLARKEIADRGQFTLSGNDVNLLKSYKLFVDRGIFSLTGNNVNLDFTVGYDINVDTGIFTLTSNNAGLNKTFKLTADRGIFSLSGQAVDLRKASKLTAETSAYTLTGNNADLEKTVLLTAQTVSYTLTGNNVDLHVVVGYDLNVEPGVFTLTGGSVTFKEGISVDTGTFALTGNTVNLKRALAVVAAKATYIETGNNVLLTAAFKLTAQEVDFFFDAYDAELDRHLIMTTITGSFSLAGSAVTFRRGYKLFADARSYTLTGNAAALVAARQFAVDRASFALTGYSTNYYIRYKVFVDRGIFTLTGTAVNFVKFTTLIANTGSFALTGNNANLSTAKTITVSTGSFNLAGGNINIARSLRVDSGQFILTGYAAVLESNAPVNSFGSYAPNNEGLTEVLIDLKLTLDILLDPATSFRKETIGFTGIAFETVNQGDAVYLRLSDGKVGKAVGNLTEQEATVAGFAQTTKAAGETVRILTAGKLATSGLAPGAVYFLAAAGAGSISTVPPSTTNQFVTRVGEAIGNSKLLINIEPCIQLK